MHNREAVNKIIHQYELEYRFEPLPPMFSMMARSQYEAMLPKWCNDPDNKEKPLYTENSLMVAKGFERVVIGDYGAYVEFRPEHMCRKNIMVKPGQEYRLRKNSIYYNNIKYEWYTVRGCDIKIYRQVECVTYADYIPGMLYISPHDLTPDPAPGAEEKN